MNPIIQNAINLLNLIIEGGKPYYENIWFQENSSLSPQDIDDAVNYLEDIGAFTVHRPLGTTPFHFGGIRVLSEARFLYYELKEKYHKEKQTQSQAFLGAEKKEKKDEWDLFISHASEDKDSIARPLAVNLKEKGVFVWYDEFTLTLGDSLRKSIDKGLLKSKFGVIILSPHFFNKQWPQKELDALFAKEMNGDKVILPVWHNVTFDDVLAYSPTLADKLGVSTSKGLDYVVNEIKKVLEE